MIKASAHTVPQRGLEPGSAIPVSNMGETDDGRIVDEHPVLLPMPAYHGTLAAVRCLGAAGIPVSSPRPLSRSIESLSIHELAL